MSLCQETLTSAWEVQRGESHKQNSGTGYRPVTAVLCLHWLQMWLTLWQCREPKVCFQVCRVLSPDWADENPSVTQRIWGADNPSCSQVMDIPHCWKCGMDWTDWITNETDAGCSEKMRTWFKLSEGLGSISVTGGIFSVAWHGKTKHSLYLRAEGMC